MDEGDSYVASLVRQSELLVYTPGAERRVRPFIERARKACRIDTRFSFLIRRARSQSDPLTSLFRPKQLHLPRRDTLLVRDKSR